MGIPKFFRWLSRRYPLILQGVKKEEDCPPVDNLYMDLNGIVHNCIHGNNAQRHEKISGLSDFEEVWAACMRAIDEVVHTIKPKKVLLLAVDGVAPRAKMNQQRARRFRSARDAQTLKEKLIAAGKDAPDLFDSNAISPGTAFMAELCAQLHFFVKYKVNTDPMYRSLDKVVLSDGQVPGEGEHKMMDYVRNLRLSPDYDPNTRHCFYGSDADLIMLSLLTHEPHFVIIRDEHVVQKRKDGGVSRMELQMTNNYQLIHIGMLREYFQLEFMPLRGQMRMKFDLERIIDDFIFFCFFIGNDFLPSLSALDIAEGSLDKLIEFYKTCLPNMENYITHNGTIHWDRAEPFIWLLGEHENETFKNRIDEMSHSYERKAHIVSVSADTMAEAANIAGHTGNARSADHLQAKLRAQLAQKKAKKFQSLQTPVDKTRYKRFLYTRKFKEDEGKLSAAQKTVRATLEAKLRKMFGEHQQKATSNAEVENGAQVKNLEEVNVLSMIKEIPDEYLSDLKQEEIPDSAVSDADIDDQSPTLQKHVSNKDENSAVMGVSLEDETSALASDAAAIEKQNFDFMKDFARTFAVDAKAAKAKYYKTKVEIDTSTTEGERQKARMLRKYLEGTQWVLYYYYKGCQHWRWYYPFHYAPMISDIGHNIVQDFLGGDPVITKFEIDSNCPVDSTPYTPFQQLFCIQPLKSMHLLPPAYGTVAQGALKEFFPSDFACDLNGKTLSYEAIVLIPFADEVQVLAEEAQLFNQGLTLSEGERLRNTISFDFFSYSYNHYKQGSNPLVSTLTNLKNLKVDNTQVFYNNDYSKVGQFCFEGRLLPGATTPSPGWPSFKYLNVMEFEKDYVVVQKRQFERFLAKCPTAIQETSPQKLEEFVNALAKQANKEIYIDFPWQQEAFPMFFEDKFSMYTLFGDAYSNKFEVRKEKQFRTEDQWNSEVNRTRYNLMQQGIFVKKDTTNVLVTCNRVQSVEYDNQENVFYKTYNEKPDVIPFSLFMSKRHQAHPMNINQKLGSPLAAYPVAKEVVILNSNLYGLCGTVGKVNPKNMTIQVNFNAQAEQAKVHDPFVARKHLEAAVSTKQGEQKGRFIQDYEIERMLKLPKGTMARMSSSFLVTYKNPENGEKMIVDIGLNIKNFSKKLHVPRYVRYVTSERDLVINQLIDDGFEHGNYGNRSKRSTWLYSVECLDIVREYFEKFPQAWEALKKCMNKNRSVHPLKELYPSEGKNDSEEAVGFVKAILAWLDTLPISKLPFVEMGFDTLDRDLLDGLDDHQERVSSEYQRCEVVSRPMEHLRPYHVFAESYPYWCSPQQERQVSDFKAGHRVLSINSTRRQYIPFGLRGTVVGKTADRVIVMFDEQFLNGTDLNGNCGPYRGQLCMPNYLLNLTMKFENLLRKGNAVDLVNKFTELAPGATTYEPHTVKNQGQDYQRSHNNRGGPQRQVGNRGDQQQQQENSQQSYGENRGARGGGKRGRGDRNDGQRGGRGERGGRDAQGRGRGQDHKQGGDNQRKAPNTNSQGNKPAKSNNDPNQPLTFQPLNPTLATNADFQEVMRAFEPGTLEKHISEGNVHMPSDSSSPALNTQAASFSPSPIAPEDQSPGTNQQEEFKNPENKEDKEASSATKPSEQK